MPFKNTRNVESRSRFSSEGAASSATLVRTDGASDKGELALRQRVVKSSLTALGSLKTAYFKAIPNLFVSPKQIADEIRRLRGHDKSTIYERYAQFHEGDHPCPQHGELISLCKKLIDLSRSYESGYAAHRELLALFMEDPIVRELSPVSDYFNMRNSSDCGDCHRRWSELLGLRTFKTNQRSETPQYKCDALKRTFYYNALGETAIEYIPYVMGLEMQNDDLVLLRQLWDSSQVYVALLVHGEFAAKFVDLCFRNIVSSGKPLAYFASPFQMAYIAMFLIKYSIHVPFVFSTFFPPPTFEFRNPKDPYGVNLVIRSPARKWDIVTASTYAFIFLDACKKGNTSSRHLLPPRDREFKSIYALIEEYGGATPFGRSVFAEKTFIDLYKTVYDAARSYLRAMGVLSKLEEDIHHALVTLVEPHLKSIVASDVSSKDKKEWDVPRNNFVIAHTVDIDRYHKHEIFERFKENDAYIDILSDRLRFQTYLRRSDGICNLTYILQFRNVSYLRRFRVGYEYFITADGLPQSSNQILNFWNQAVFPEDIVVDTMQLDGKILTCLWVAESSVFNCTGHYPILAGVDFETNEPLFVAVVYRRVNSPWYFTTVKDCASSVTYTDEVGEEYITKGFFVLALRHDPIDLPPQDVQHREGEKDPTGTVYWVEFWPKKDAHYFYDERLRDDRLLESFLDEQRIMGIILGGFD